MKKLKSLPDKSKALHTNLECAAFDVWNDELICRSFAAYIQEQDSGRVCRVTLLGYGKRSNVAWRHFGGRVSAWFVTHDFYNDCLEELAL